MTEANTYSKEQPFAVGDTVLWIASVNGVSPVTGKVVDALGNHFVRVEWYEKIFGHKYDERHRLPSGKTWAYQSAGHWFYPVRSEWTGNLLLVLPLLDEDPTP